MNITTQELVQKLRLQPLHISFVKKDGSMRLMTATLQEQLLPVRTSTPPATQSPPSPPSSHVIRVWDLDKQAWRSIIIASIVSVSDAQNLP